MHFVTWFYLGTEFHTDESLGILMELELTKPTEELLERLFLASQKTRMQGSDENCEELTVYYRVLVLVYILGLISGVLMVVLVCFVVNYTFGGRYAESPVNCVEAGTQVDLLACDEQLNRGVGSRLELPAVAAKAGGIGESLHMLLGIWTCKTVIAKERERDQAGLESGCVGAPSTQHAYVDNAERKVTRLAQELNSLRSSKA